MKHIKGINEDFMKNRVENNEEMSEGFTDNAKKVAMGAMLLGGLASCSKPNAKDDPAPKTSIPASIPKDTIKSTTDGTWYPYCNTNPTDQHYIIKDNKFDWHWDKDAIIVYYTFKVESNGSFTFTFVSASDNRFDPDTKPKAIFKNGVLEVNGTKCVKLK